MEAMCWSKSVAGSPKPTYWIGAAAQGQFASQFTLIVCFKDEQIEAPKSNMT